MVKAFRIGVGMLLLAACVQSARAASPLLPDTVGEIRTVVVDGNWFEIGAGPTVFNADWLSSATLAGQAKLVSQKPGNWTDRLSLSGGQTFLYQQTIADEAGASVVSAEISAESNGSNQGAFYTMTLPVSTFSGGSIELQTDAGITPNTIMLPATAPAEAHLLQADAHGLIICDSQGQFTAEIGFDHPAHVLVQDERSWHSQGYGILISLSNGPMTVGQHAAIRMTERFSGHADRTHVELKIAPDPRSHPFDGIGGNYCFNTESPVTEFTLHMLHSGWARVEMQLADWLGTSENLPPDDDERAWSLRDDPQSTVRHELEMAGALASAKVPMIITDWRLPASYFVDPKAKRGAVRADKWDAITRGVVSYLRHARDVYHAEPVMFSFNEADYGVDLKFTPEEHRDEIRRIGAAMQRAGLKTKILTGDITHPADNTAFVDTALADPVARSFIGGIAFHSWGGGSNEAYRAWSATAENNHLPLFVTELGYDPDWKQPDSWRQSELYAMHELLIGMQLLSVARPVTMLQWEFTGDYALARVKVDKDQPGINTTWTTGERFHFLHQLCNLTPTPSHYLLSTSDHPNVLIAAMSADTQIAIHIANFGPQRPAVISGLPAGIGNLHVLSTNNELIEKYAHDAFVEHGETEINLPPQSLTTLTTIDR